MWLKCFNFIFQLLRKLLKNECLKTYTCTNIQKMRWGKMRFWWEHPSCEFLIDLCCIFRWGHKSQGFPMGPSWACKFSTYKTLMLKSKKLKWDKGNITLVLLVYLNLLICRPGSYWKIEEKHRKISMKQKGKVNKTLSTEDWNHPLNEQ